LLLSDPLRSPFVANVAALGRRISALRRKLPMPLGRDPTSEHQKCKASAKASGKDECLAYMAELSNYADISPGRLVSEPEIKSTAAKSNRRHPSLAARDGHGRRNRLMLPWLARNLNY
jgi:hypothetical protein